MIIGLIDGHMSVSILRSCIAALCSRQSCPDLACHRAHGVDGVVDAFLT